MKDKPVILVIDDQPQNIELLEAHLVLQGYEIVKAANGEEALGKLSGNQIDLILLDVMMPGMDGFEVTRRIRQDNTHRLLPIILITVLRETEDRVKGIEAGCDDFISMPVDKMELLARVRSLLKVKAYNDLMSNYRTELESEVARRTDELRHALENLQQDITERKRAEEQLLYQAALLANVNDAIVASDAHYRLTAWNAAAESMYGWKAEELLGQNGLNIVRTEWPEVDADAMRRTIAETGRWRGEAIQARKDGTRFPVEISTIVLRDESGKITGYVSVNRDITERKLAEEVLRVKEERYRELFDNISSGVAVYEVKDNGEDFVFVDFNKAGEYLDGDRREDLIGKSVFQVRPGIKEFGLIEVFKRVWKTGTAEYFPHKLYQDDRLVKWYENFVYRLPTGEIVALYNDVSERKRAEEQIRNDLKEKELLLKEIHHRVKNNLQIIISLIRLQARSVEDVVALKAFEDSINRIHSMSQVHEQLYASNDFARIPFNSYVERIANHLVSNYDMSSRISLDLNIQNIELGIDTAIPCGLLLNELLTNSLKYAYPDNRKGVIKISMRLRKDKKYELIFRDNGIGFGGHTDGIETESFGMRLIKMLIEQLNGKMVLTGDEGTCYKITFPKVLK